MTKKDLHVAGLRVNAPVSESTQFLRRIQSAIVKHPLASQAIMNLLIREGRRFQETEAGRLRARHLATSPLVQRARAAWETSGGWLLDEQPEGMIPSNFLDALLDVAAQGDTATDENNRTND